MLVWQKPHLCSVSLHDAMTNTFRPICGLRLFYIGCVYQFAWNLDQGETKSSTKH